MKDISTRGLTFAEIREKDKYYVDKSLLIKDILDSDGEGVYLFTRPRRFGKSTNLSMLDAFFNIKYKGNTWFDDLEISKYPEYEKYKNAFPVIYLDLKNTEVDDYDTFVTRVRSSLSLLFNSFGYLLKMEDIPEADIELFQQVSKLNVDVGRIEDGIPLLCRLLERYHGVKPIILIDEYDRAVSDAFGSESHEPMMKLLGKILGAALKSNDSLQMAVVTGIMQIAKESIFSGLNNLKVNNVFSKMSDERYGFTEDEIKRILDDYSHPQKFKEAKRWYDGYRFGNADIYNPWSIMNYVSSDFEPLSYWSNSGSDHIFRWMLERISGSNFSKILDLAEGRSFRTELVPELSYGDVRADDISLFSLMTMSGYLKAIRTREEDVYKVSVPNHEVRKILTRMLEHVDAIEDALFVEFNRAVLAGDADTMVADLNQFLLSASYLNLNAENAYGLVLMTIMHQVANRYEISTEHEAGNGRTDIILKPEKEGTIPIIFELKRENVEDKLDAAVDDAIAQIHKKKYYWGMKGKVILVGMAFCGKIPEARVETIDNGDGFSYKKAP